MNVIHGGDWAGFVSEYGVMPLDFSQNISPMGMPEGVRRATEHCIEAGMADIYPDPLCRALRKAIAAYHGVSMDEVLCGNGAADLIWRLFAALRPSCTVLTAPGFSEYEAAAKAHGSTIRYHRLRECENFALTDRILEDITPETGLVVLCQPNNPTGVIASRRLMERILNRCKAVGAILAVDECFLDFLPQGETLTLLSALDDGSLLILRAFTKTYAMAGLRLGYCLSSDRTLLNNMQKAGQPWPVSAVAQAAGIAALQEGAYLAALRGMIAKQREILVSGLNVLGCRVIPGEGNFILFQAPFDSLAQWLRGKGILIRDCRNYHGLDAGWYRVAVRNEKENKCLLGAMKEVLAAWQNV